MRLNLNVERSSERINVRCDDDMEYKFVDPLSVLIHDAYGDEHSPTLKPK